MEGDVTSDMGKETKTIAELEAEYLGWSARQRLHALEEASWYGYVLRSAPGGAVGLDGPELEAYLNSFAHAVAGGIYAEVHAPEDNEDDDDEEEDATGEAD